jgi:beta-glucosidase
MTLEEKAGQLGNDAPAIRRLGVPKYNWWNEGLHGVARAGYATVFPQAIGMAATWDPALMRAAGDVIATEFRAKYLQARDPDGGSEWYRGLTVWSPNTSRCTAARNRTATAKTCTRPITTSRTPTCRPSARR